MLCYRLHFFSGGIKVACEELDNGDCGKRGSFGPQGARAQGDGLKTEGTDVLYLFLVETSLRTKKQADGISAC